MFVQPGRWVKGEVGSRPGVGLASVNFHEGDVESRTDTSFDAYYGASGTAVALAAEEVSIDTRATLNAHAGCSKPAAQLIDVSGIGYLHVGADPSPGRKQESTASGCSSTNADLSIPVVNPDDNWTDLSSTPDPCTNTQGPTETDGNAPGGIGHVGGRVCCVCVGLTAEGLQGVLAGESAEVGRVGAGSHVVEAAGGVLILAGEVEGW